MEFDCIIVLANEMDRFGKLNKESLNRLNYTAQQFFNKRSNTIISCGWDYRNDSDLVIAEVFRDWFLSAGIPKKQIITEINSRDTVGDAIFSKINIVTKRNWKKILVVTSYYHVKRTKIIFDFIYGSNYSIKVEASDKITSSILLDKEKKSTNIFNFTFKGIVSGNDFKIYQRMRELHPFYNGDIYSKIN